MTKRFAFYERAKNAYLIIATGETAIYANILLKKGLSHTDKPPPPVEENALRRTGAV